MKILAFDIDLNRIHAVSSEFGIICCNSTEIPYDAIIRHDRLLIEVASPTLYLKSPYELRNRLKWVIYNSMIAGRIYEFYTPNDAILVSPSSLWTCSHDEPMRHSIAGVSGDNHDIRECKTMLFYHKTNPEKWVSFEQYFEQLSTKKGKKK